MDSGKKFTYYVIDNWLLQNVTISRPNVYSDNLEYFKNNVGEELMKHVNIISMDSLEAIKQFKDDSVYACFLDDSHVYSHVTKQIGLWLPKMKDFSILYGDDYYSPDVSNAVRDHFDDEHVHKLFDKGGFLVYNPKEKVKTV